MPKTPAERVDRGRIAEQLFENEVLIDALDTLDHKAYKAFWGARTDDERRNVQAIVKATGWFRMAIKAVIADKEKALKEMSYEKVRKLQFKDEDAA